MTLVWRSCWIGSGQYLNVKDLDPRILSFILRLTGLFTASNDYFDELEENGIVSSLFGNPANLGTEVWEEATVRCGWLLGIQNMLRHEAALQFLQKHGSIEAIIQLQKDSSLFVASAAIQLLANVLTFSFQNSELANIPLDTDTTNTITSVPSPECQDCAYAIIEHIEGFLRSSIPSKVRQALKLLSKVSGTCHPVVIASLWPKVAESVELLVKGDLDGIGQQLVELFVNLSRTAPSEVLDSGIWELMGILLNTLKQNEALALASGVIKLQNCPQPLRRQSLTTVLQPLNSIAVSSTQPQDSALLEVPSGCRADIEDHLIRKSTCINLLCQTISYLRELLETPLQPVDLQCDALTSSLLTVLQMCTGAAIPTSPAGVMFSKHLIGCIKVQRAGLDTLGAVAQWAGSCKEVGNTMNLLLDYLRNPDTDPTVLKKSLQALLCWMQHCNEATDSHTLGSKVQEFLNGDFTSVLKKRLFDIRWEVRDSTLEFLGHLCFQFKESDSFCVLLASSGIQQLIVDLLSDPESYVRASAVTALGQMKYLAHDWQPLLNQETILSRLLEILKQDSEGFPRRAVVKVFAEWAKHCDVLSGQELENSISVVLMAGSGDLDWEVKVHSLEVAEAFIDQAVAKLSPCPYTALLTRNPQSAEVRSFLQNLCDVGIFSVLFNALWDCDRPAAQKACEILIKLKKIISSGNRADGKEVHEILNGHSLGRESFSSWLSDHGLNLQNGTHVLEVIIALDLEFQHRQLDCSSDHIESSLRSLLQDILAAASHSDEDGADCY
ncbi:BRCA1-associated ATM activator 1 isoform X2 [Callorhinchus milii]|uniref:BRCA1-associated ATM activator 1 isoform X2 n=1 Tax=Callorhinchus milii TaxID=7868 RepID=UPI0004572AF9|nr:BRCA1-associated ATM activator 1 isoform X2 [Callorhinchus milii]|eukprot:gi/632975505/ref/XP_007904267.1/ PREDICTED: BRCA1-associated ATM activator 1 isoform X2 [Callorhinchus milii]